MLLPFTGRSFCLLLFRFHFSYVLTYVLRVQFNNMLQFSLHVNPLIGVHHLIVFETNRKPFSYPFLKRLPVPLLLLAPSRLRLSSLRLTFVDLRFFSRRLLMKTERKRRDRDSIPRPMVPCADE